MKKPDKIKRVMLYILISVAFSGYGQYHVNISGTVTEGPAGFPVPEQPVFLSIMIQYDSLNIITGNVITNDSGFYSYGFVMNGHFARADISTPDCNGAALSSTIFIDTSASSVIQDFTTCSFSVCQALFIYEQTWDYTFQFTDLSTGQGWNYFWDFGDNNTSSAQHPVHSYNAPGIYEVCLFISAPDSTCFDMYCAQVVAGSNGSCIAQFTCYPDSMQNGYSYQFVDLSSGNINSWSWSFGDGTYSQEQNPVHVFEELGQYEVCLSISGPECESTWCEFVSVSLVGDCYNYFTYQASGTSVLFSGIHFPGISSLFNWDFGDGTTGEGQTVSHTYTEYGVYYVSLISSDSMSCSTISSQFVAVGDTIMFNQVYGQVFEGGFPMADGWVVISSIQNNPGFEPFSDISAVDSTGVFVFPYVPNGQFVLYAVSENDNGYLPTYYGGVQHWTDATSINSAETGMLYTINLTPVRSSVNPGNGSITGFISESFAREDLLQMINILLYNESFESLAFTTVLPDGSFGFYGLANGLYYLYPELPGVSSNIIPVELSEQIQNRVVYLDFNGTSILGEAELILVEDAGTVYPNPASTHASISIRCSQAGCLIMHLFDLSGRKVFSEFFQANSGQTTMEFQVQNLVPGIYLLHLSDSSGRIVTRKFMVK